MYNKQKFKTLVAADGRVKANSNEYQITSSAQFSIMRKLFVESMEYDAMATLVDESLERGDKLCDFRHVVDRMAIAAFEDSFKC